MTVSRAIQRQASRAKKCQWKKSATFEEQNLRTDDPTCSFVFSLMSAIAENESRSISENVKWGQRERVKRGEFNLGNNRLLGYDTVDGKLVPNEYADSVRLIYTLYLQGVSICFITTQTL
jgi:DNA invertase Pin-like site-specific DNA recombinase